MQVIFSNSLILTTQEQPLLTLDREFCAIAFALSQFEIIYIGSNFPISIFIDHNPILFLIIREGNPKPRQYKNQMLLTKFSNIQNNLTAGTILTVALMLSQNTSSITSTMLRLHLKTFPQLRRNMEKSLNLTYDTLSHTNSITQTLINSTSTQSLHFFD